jgi:hypothetical protein
VLAALRLVLFDDGDPLGKSIALSPAITWLVVVGGVYGALRAAWDICKILWLGKRSRPAPPRVGGSSDNWPGRREA